MATRSLPPLVSTVWLAERQGAPDLVILDASWYLPSTGRSGRGEFLTGHVPGARYFDLDASSDPNSTLPHMLPEAERFSRFVGKLGVANESQVIVYDGSGGNLSAARVWWMFRAFGHDAVALLDGGLGKWRAEGRAVETGKPALAPRAYRAAATPREVVALEEVSSALASGAAQVVDMRSGERFRAQVAEPREGLASGHMPGAVSLPYSELVRADGTALPPEELQARIRLAGVALDRPIIATCGSGVSACTLLHALERLGVPGARLYDGSWTEWATLGMPIATGDP